MGIPKTNNFSEALVEQHDNTSLTAGTSGFDSSSVFARLLRASAGVFMLLVSLSAPLQCGAAQLDASALTGPNTLSLVSARNIGMVSASYVDEVTSAKHSRARPDTGFLEADITDFAAKPVRNTASGVAPRLTEFGSLGVSSIPPFGLPLPSMDGTDNSPTGAAAAGMPIMVLVWLFGVGLIGMGTVGRRKQVKP